MYKKENNELKEILYNWATKPKGNGGLFNSNGNTRTYETIAPVETDKGFEGFGVLWWEIPNYGRLNIYMLICNTVNDSKTYQKFANNAYGQRFIINNKEYYFNELPFETNTSKNINSPIKTNGYNTWTFMINPGTYNISGKTNFGKINEYYNSNSFLNNNANYHLIGEEPNQTDYYSLQIGNNTEENLYIANILQTVVAKLKPKSTIVNWDRVETQVEAESSLFTDWFDASHNRINKVAGYYELDPNDSKILERNNSRVNIKLDKYDELSATKHQPIKFHQFQYWTRSRTYMGLSIFWPIYGC